MAYLIDSSFVIDLERRRAPISELRERFGDARLAIATITLFEILVGVHRANDDIRRARRRRNLDLLTELARILPFDESVARRHALITAELTAKGDIVGAHDLIIASTAIVHDMTLLTLDRRHFTRVPGLFMLAPPFD